MAKKWFFDLLPLRPAPYPGECITGYLLRLADVNAYRYFKEFFSNISPRRELHDRLKRLKGEIPTKEWQSVSLLTGLTINELSKLTVIHWIEKFRPVPDYCEWGSSGRFNLLKKLIDPVLKICPVCLQAQPFIRLIWRLVPVTVCIEHKIFLQGKCSVCNNILTPIGAHHHHLHCPACDSDLRLQSVNAATPHVSNIQKRIQDNFSFLLDSSTSILKLSKMNFLNMHDLSLVLGMKFGYIRKRAGIRTAVLAKRTKLSPTIISRIEYPPHPMPLLHYLKYLEAMRLSWKEFAVIEVPNEYVEAFEYIHNRTRFMKLRICPNAKCSNHSCATSDVSLIKDLPLRGAATFLCKACCWSFTRSYDGQLLI